MTTSNAAIAQNFQNLATPHIADACVRLGEAFFPAVGVHAIHSDCPVAGRVFAVKHHGSVDVFLEAFEQIGTGDVIVIDDGGRLDRGCIGDLTVLEAQLAGAAGFVVWGAVRDVPELAEIGLPVYAIQRCPAGPLAAEASGVSENQSIKLCGQSVQTGDYVFADDNGVVVVRSARLDEVFEVAAQIAATEFAQAQLIREGKSLRDQLGLRDYQKMRAANPSYTLREHLRQTGGAIET